MSRDRADQGLLFQQLWTFASYKGNQGKIARRSTCFAIVGLLFLTLWNVAGSATASPLLSSVVLVVGLAGLWLSYRIVNVPRFAEFLIAVEAEMAKVSWPTWTELSRSSLVVILVIFTLTLLLFVFDSFWMFLFQQMKIMRY